ncbi:hypothetical protein BXZ70DRAFT_1013744 [Cristinia sonorae]|uniref:RNA polymerase II-associated protein n=1 Tax=Cristinia sonorae TaxID=1940300 RepID=A0A8K0XVF8_9AGAR|nr:hypothetical protein BXZ70DRAFT_1013744 [Cristinia sonorae]
MNGERSPSPPVGRTLDIELTSQEVISVDLDNLELNPDDLLEVLKDSQSKVWVWTKLAAEYWNQGHLDIAEKLAQGAIDTLQYNGSTSTLPPLYYLLANIQIARARRAPKLILQDARQDNMAKEKQRDAFYKEAIQLLNQGDKTESEEGISPTLAFLTRAIYQLENRQMDDALRSFDGVLANKPTNVVALLGKARILYTRRQYAQSLRLFQEVLRLSPHCKPDPRIGIGLCFWALDHKAQAKAAWERSLEVNPTEWAAQLLLGLEAMNASKNEALPEEERRHQYIQGTRLINIAFKANQKNSAAANALCELLLRKGQFDKALKLAERTIQYADTLTVLTEGYIRAARVLSSTDLHTDAQRYYTIAKEGQPANVLASVGLAQSQLKLDEIAAAIHTLDTLLQAPNENRSPEASVMLASLRANPRPGADQAQEKTRARELYDRVSRALRLPEDAHSHLNGHSHKPLSSAGRSIAEDLEVHTEMARLWQGESSDKVERALTEALRISETSAKPDPRLINNLAALKHLDGKLDQARVMYETALTHAATVEGGSGEGMSTSILYNLARVYEDEGNETMAKEAYDKLLTRHPEYVDAKVRLAKMLSDLNKSNEAHELLKEALSSQNSNLNLRAFYTYFLIQNNMATPAKDFVFRTLKEHERYDLYSLCAAGWIQYHQARESRDASSKGIEERRRGFQRSAEFYEKALHLDPMCAIAAQGLAIVTAEDALGNLGGALGPPTPDEAQKRVKNAREALDVFAKVREALDDGSVYSNMGHCYYASDDYDRAIESYETASRKFYHDHNVPVLLCLCRSWYAKANKNQSFSSMNTALAYAQRAYHLHPHDKAILYNIAMVQQKAAEMLFAIVPAKRTLKDLQKAIMQAQHAQKLFASLAADKSPVVPYNKDLADQRRKYGDSVLRRCDEHLAAQKQFEAEAKARVDAARQRRQEEKERVEALEEQRRIENERLAGELAEKRRIAREQALEWTREVRMESDEEKEKKAKKAVRKPKAENGGGSGDEANGGEPKKKKKGGKLKRRDTDGEVGEAGDTFSGDEDGESKPTKKRTKKRVVRDEDEEEVASAAPKRKQFKSKEYISDSDEDMS